MFPFQLYIVHFLWILRASHRKDISTDMSFHHVLGPCPGKFHRYHTPSASRDQFPRNDILHNRRSSGIHKHPIQHRIIMNTWKQINGRRQKGMWKVLKSCEKRKSVSVWTIKICLPVEKKSLYILYGKLPFVDPNSKHLCRSIQHSHRNYLISCSLSTSHTALPKALIQLFFCMSAPEFPFKFGWIRTTK